MRRWLLWLTIGALLAYHAGAIVITRDGEMLLGPGVLTGALLFWLFVTAAVLRRRFARTGRDSSRNPMPRRPERLTCIPLLLAAGLGAYAAPAAAQEAPTRPNFVLVFADDQGYGDLGVFGATDFETPRIDRMAHEGMRFTSFYAQPVCGPSRTALLTGSYPIRVELLEPVTGLELYNLETDIGESRNVAADHPDVVDRLTALADRARAELGDHDRIGSGVRFFEEGPRWPRRQPWITQ